MWTITVTGTPAPKGSMKCVGGRGGRHRIIEDDKNATRGPWRAKLTAAGVKIRNANGGPLQGPVAVDLAFRIARPKSAARRAFPEVRPDIDKLARMVLDALTDSAVFVDDSRVVDLTATKRYPGPGETPGVTLTISELTESTEP